MSSDEIIESPKGSGKNKPRPSTDPLDPPFALWLERQFRGGETPQVIDAFPLFKGRDREQRLYHYSIKADEKIDTERAVQLSNEIFSDCQIHCDNLPLTALGRDGTKTYEVAVIDKSRGGIAQPVGTRLLKLEQRVHRPAPDEDHEHDDLSADDSETISSRKMMLETFKEINGRSERGQAGVLTAAGDILMLQKESLKDQFGMIRDLLADNRMLMGEFREMIRAEGQRRVEEKAVAIDAANAEVQRELLRAQMGKENMWTDVQRAAMLEGINVLGKLFPGFGQLAVALVSGKPVPDPPKLNGTSSTPAASGQPQLPAATVSEEKMLVDRFINTAEKHKVDATSTAAEKLFGKDDDTGKPLEPGVFTREQVAILSGVHTGALGIEALDGLLPGSGKPEEIQSLQMVRAMAYLTPDMVSDITKVLEMRKAKK